MTIPAGVTRLEGYTFMGTKITKLTIPKTLVVINAYDFESDKLEEITFEYGPDTLRMNDTSFGLWCTAKTVTIDRPFKWRKDRDMSFGYAETVTFGPHIESIPERALYGMSYLKKVTMTDNVKAIGKHAFYSAFSDEGYELTVSKKVETIGERAFAYSTLRSFTFPVTVKEIGEQAFTSTQWHNHYLKDVYVPWLTPLAVKDSDPESEYKMFYYDDNLTLWVPGGTMDAYKAAEVWGSFKKFDYWSYVVQASVTGKGSIKIANGEAVTDNGTNTEQTAKGEKLVAEGAGEAVSGLFVREKDLTLTPTPARGYELKTLKANDADLTAVEGAYRVTNLLADQTICANFTPIIYNIVYDLNGGILPEGKENPVTYTVEDVEIILVNPTRTGYTFTGWTGTGLEETTMDVTIAAGSIGNRTYIATWEANPYKVRFDANSGEGEMADQDFAYDVAQQLAANTFTRTGYTFTGWNSKADGTGTAYEDKQEVKNLTDMRDAVVTLYAQWQLTTYTIAYDLEGGTAEGNHIMAANARRQEMGD